MTHRQLIARYERFVALRKKGWTYQEIADKYGISNSAVFNRVKKGAPKRGDSVPGPLSGMQEHHKKGRGRTRMLVRIRDKFTCKDCGKKRTLEEVRKYNSKIKGLKGRLKLFDIHHTGGLCGKNSKGYDSTQDISGLITLCHKCHYNRPEHRVHTKEYKENLSKGQIARYGREKQQKTISNYFS